MKEITSTPPPHPPPHPTPINGRKFVKSCVAHNLVFFNSRPTYFLKLFRYMQNS